MKTKILIPFLIITVLLTVSGCGCKSSSPHQYNMTLEIWGPVDDSFTLSDIFEAYKKINPNISEINYKKVNVDTYKKELIEAMASGQGPDIFLVHNDWLPSFKDKIVSAPTTILGEQQYRQEFVDVCANDFINDGAIWAAPLSVDSLGLYYNKDLFNEAGITSPPKDWNQFVDNVRRLTKVNSSNEIVQSGAALGTAYNINRSTDVLNLLMMQNGTELLDDQGRVALDESKIVNGTNYSPTENALRFYTDFAKTGSLNYSWNSRMHYSIDAFSEGSVAMMFNYSWHIQTVKDKSPKLNFAVAPVPQFPGSAAVNFANYWAFAVSKNKVLQTGVSSDARVSEAWKFIKFLTTKPESGFTQIGGGLNSGQSINLDPAADYLNATQKPAARRDLIEQQKTDPDLGVFAKDNLIAKSWLLKDPETTESILAEMVDQVNRGQTSIYEAVQAAAQRISVIMTQ